MPYFSSSSAVFWKEGGWEEYLFLVDGFFLVLRVCLLICMLISVTDFNLIKFQLASDVLVAWLRLFVFSCLILCGGVLFVCKV